MPLYDVRCPECGHEQNDVFCHMAERDALKCAACGHPRVETNPTQFERVAVEREWHGDECLSMGHAYDPDNIDEIKRECPDVELDELGRLKSRNDKHHRTQLKQLSAWKQRIEARDRETEERERDPNVVGRMEERQRQLETAGRMKDMADD